MGNKILGVDCGVKLTAQNCKDLAAAGYAFVGRYLVPNSGTTAWKALTKEECQRITAAGMSILTVWELSETRPKKGYAAGLEDGAKAYDLAKQIEMPTDGIIYFAVDYDAQPSDYESIFAYLKGARDETGPYEIGVYGGYSLIEWLKMKNLCRGYWQTLAWSYGKLSHARTVYQAVAQTNIAGVSVDINECENLTTAGIWAYMKGESDLTKTEVIELIEAAQKETLGEIKTLLRGSGTTPNLWAVNELTEAKNLGITDGTRPQGYATREEVALMVVRGIDTASMCKIQLDDNK